MTSSVYDTLTRVSADLHQQGITLVISANTKTRGDAWSEASAQHGDKVALIHLENGSWASFRPVVYDRLDVIPVTELYVDFAFGDAETGANIYDILRLHGFTAEWDHDATKAIVIKL